MIRKYISVRVLMLLAGLFALLWGLYTAYSHRNIAEAQSPTQKVGFAVNKALEKWLDRLSIYEACPSEGIIDSNGLRSYGDFCYQESTFLFFMKMPKYRALMPFAEDGELINNLSDSSFQRELTRAIVLNEPISTVKKLWFTSTVIRKGLGLPPIPAQ